MAITNLPIPPSRSDPENFPERADLFMAALPRFASEANTLQEQVNEAAATVDADAAAAGASRDAAAESQRLAGLSAQGAETARQVAVQKAGEADANAQRARQWATKIGAPVEGDGFSAKHYAELAAQGAGLPIYMPDSVPSQDVGPIFIVRQGNAEWDQASGRYRVHSSIALGTVAFWPLRSSIPAGHIPADGQTVSRATFPDLAQMVIDGKVPVVTDADWLADPLKRGSYTLGNGSTTIRLPDYNGWAAGSVGALFMRGDGSLSSGTNGVIQRDAIENIKGKFDIGWGALKGRLAMDPAQQVSGPLRYNLGPGDGRVINSELRGGFSDYLEAYTFDASLVARTAAETRPSNVSGVWTIQAFGAVTNPGSVDVAQLATDYAALNAALQTLSGQLQAVDGQFQTLKAKVFGVDQAWASFTAGAGANQRMTTVTYVNSTSRPIIVAIQFSTTGNNGYLIGFVDGKSVAFGSWGPSGSGLGISFIVPSGSSYRVDSALATNIEWREYR